MNEDRLDHIRRMLITNIFRNPDVIFNVDPEIVDLIVALYEELHMMVMHKHYDYMWHWINKCTGSIQDTMVFDSTGTQLILLKEVLNNGKEKVIVEGCTSCPYAGHFELKECPDAYTPVSHFCNLYSKEVLSYGKEKQE